MRSDGRYIRELKESIEKTAKTGQETEQGWKEAATAWKAAHEQQLKFQHILDCIDQNSTEIYIRKQSKSSGVDVMYAYITTKSGKMIYGEGNNLLNVVKDLFDQVNLEMEK